MGVALQMNKISMETENYSNARSSLLITKGSRALHLAFERSSEEGLAVKSLPLRIFIEDLVLVNLTQHAVKSCRRNLLQMGDE